MNDEEKVKAFIKQVLEGGKVTSDKDAPQSEYKDAARLEEEYSNALSRLELARSQWSVHLQGRIAELHEENERQARALREARVLLKRAIERVAYKLDAFPGKQFCGDCAVDEWHEEHQIWCIKRDVRAWLDANPEYVKGERNLK